MITVPAMRLHQFGVYFYQAILGVRDVQKLVRFEVLSYTGQRLSGKKPVKTVRGAKINWDVLERRITVFLDFQTPAARSTRSEREAP